MPAAPRFKKYAKVAVVSLVAGRVRRGEYIVTRCNRIAMDLSGFMGEMKVYEDQIGDNFRVVPAAEADAVEAELTAKAKAGA